MHYDIYIYIYLLTAIRLTPGGSSTVHIYTQTVYGTTQLTKHRTTHRTTQLTTSWEECGLCPVFASYTLAFALQLRKKRGKTSVRVAEECQLAQWKPNIQNRTYIIRRIHKHEIKNRKGVFVVFRNYFIFVTAVTEWSCTGLVAEYTVLYVRYIPQNRKESFRTARIKIWQYRRTE